MVVAALAEEQKADTLLFLNNNIEAVTSLTSGWGSLAVKLVKRLLDGMPTPLLKKEFKSFLKVFKQI